MLQPALARPDALPMPTYGGLLQASIDAASEAMQLPHTRGLTAENIHQEMLGYERFLVTTARHLRTLMAAANVPIDSRWRSTARLTRRFLSGETDSAWNRAATCLGAAHDLLATHLTNGLVPRTVEGHELVLGHAPEGVIVQLSQLLVDAAESARKLMRRGMLAQKHETERVIPTPTFRRIRDANYATVLHAQSTLWQLRNTPAHGGARLGDLQPAPCGAPDLLNEAFETSIATLRLLRHLTFVQARSSMPASPASIRDVATLGARVTDPATMVLAECTSGLDRVRRADALDKLDAAHSAWSLAARDLTETVRGTTKAPAVFGRAITKMLDAELTPALRTAVAAALPRLGLDVSRIVERLSSDGALVTLQHVRGRERAMWLPIEGDRGSEIADRFTDAAHLTLPASAAVQRLNDRRSHPATSPRTSPGPEQLHRRVLGRPTYVQP